MVAALIAGGSPLPSVVFIADEESRDGTLLAVDLETMQSPDLDEGDPLEARFRIESKHVVAMTANLALANMDFSDWQR